LYFECQATLRTWTAANLGQQVAHLDCRFDAIEIGHEHIGDKHVGPECRSQLKGFLAGIDSPGIKSALIEDESKGIGDQFFVVSNKYFWLVSHAVVSGKMQNRFCGLSEQEGS
jgi:hypothetical protein